MPPDESPLGAPAGPGAETAVSAAAPRRRARLRAFDSLAVPQFRWYLTAFLTSAFGFQSQVVVRAWLVFNLTDSALAVGAVEVISSVSNLAASPIGGVLADRIERRRLIAAMQGVLGLAGLVIGLLTAFDAIEYWHLLAAAGVTGAATGALMPARFAYVFNVAGPAHSANALALVGGSIAAMRLLAPAVGGPLIKYAGAESVYFLMAGGFLLSVPVVLTTRGTTAQDTRGSASSPLRDLRQALGYLWRNRLLRWIILITLGTELLGESVFSQFAAFSEDALDLDETGYGFLLTMVGAGAVAGSVAVALLPAQGGKGPAFLASGAAWGAAVVLFGLAPNVATAAVFAFAMGAASAGVGALGNIMVQNATEDVYRGRMLSFRMVNAAPLGTVVIGAIAEARGIRTGVLVLGAVLAAFVVAAGLWRRDVRRAV